MQDDEYLPPFDPCRLEYWHEESDDEYPVNKMEKVACVMITPKYEYHGTDDVHRRVHKYLTQVQFLPKPLDACFYEEVTRFVDAFADIKSIVDVVKTTAGFKDVVKAVNKATKNDIEVLFVMFVGHGTASNGMLLQDHQSMTRQQLHRIVRASKFAGTLIDVYCMCHAQGPQYASFGDSIVGPGVSVLDKANAPRMSIYSSTYYPQTYSNGLAFLRRFRRIVFGEGYGIFPRYADVSAEALTPTAGEVESARNDLHKEKRSNQMVDEWDEWDDADILKAAQTPVVLVCGLDVSNEWIKKRLVDLNLRIFDPLPSDLIPLTIDRDA